MNIEVHFRGCHISGHQLHNWYKKSFRFFMILALIVASAIHFNFLQVFKGFVFSLTTVLIGVIWAMGTMVLLGFNITYFCGTLFPPILIIIRYMKTVYISLQKYHYEFALHGNQAKISGQGGSARWTCNIFDKCHHSRGFGSFIVTSNPIMVEFWHYCGC